LPLQSRKHRGHYQLVGDIGEAEKFDVQNIITHEIWSLDELLDIYSPSTCSDVTM
jgi:hypothetical protein